MTNVTISEYGHIGCDNISTNNDKFVGKRDLEPLLFQELYDFWLQDEDTQKVLSFKNKQCLKATSYVGVIQTKNLSLEILPKIYTNTTNEIDQDGFRNIFIQMLKPLLNINEMQINKANLSTTKNKNIYEAFIEMFIQSMDKLIKKGIKSDYIAKEENQSFLKGKLKLKEHLKLNYIHKERFYVEFDEYLQDRTANRLLKSTILLLLKKTKDARNKNALRRQSFVFDEVNEAQNPKQDFKKIKIDRGMGHYSLPLRFAKVFLLNESFSSMRGSDNVFALLFPMEKVFESYMGFVLNNSKGTLGIENIAPNGNRGDYFIQECTFHEDRGLINLQPDYLLIIKNGGGVNFLVVADAKWKLFGGEGEEEQNNATPSISDVYQMFAYLNFYDNCDNAYLLVPQTTFDDIKTFAYLPKTSIKYGECRKYLHIAPINLQECIKNNHELAQTPFTHN